MWHSMRGRFAAIAGTAVAVALLAAAYGTWQVVRTAREARAAALAHERVQALLADFTGEVHAAELAMHRHLTFLEASDRAAAEAALRRAGEAARALAADPAVRADPVLRREVGALLGAFAELRGGVGEVLARLESAATRYPGMPILLGELFPTNQRFLDTLRGALQAAEEAEREGEPGARETVELLWRLRYAWSQLVSNVRLFIANRSGVFGDPERAMAANLRDRALYVAEVRDLLARLRRMAEAGRLPFGVDEAVTELERLHQRYETVFARAERIYRSEGWRAEIPVLRGRVVPAQRAFWEAADRIGRRLAALARERGASHMRVATALLTVLWVFALGMAVLMLAAYAGFERLIHRPLAVVARAMEREGAGGEPLPMPRADVEEVRGLVRAFEGMRAQVHQREHRLRAILDHAAEAVITVDAEGRIEGFNRAAERLFGWRAAEVLGADITLLVPPEERPRARRWLRRLVRRGTGSEPRPVTVSGLRRDGRRVALELSVSVLELEGRRLVTALASDVSEREAMLAHLRELAERDPLTGVYNRHYLMQELDRALERARRGQGGGFALLYVDLDNFKFVNDSLGHLTGDRVLREVTELLRQRARRGDVLARLGGDEFAVVLHGVDEDAALAAAEGYRRQLAGYSVHHEGGSIHVGCSIGVAVLGPDVGSREDLLARADVAVQLAKRAGRNRVHLFRPEDRGDIESMSADIGWVRRIRQAIEEERFVLARQPIVHCADRAVCGHEVLVRMLDEKGATVLPGGFLPSAERFGLMGDIDRWVVEHALGQMAAGTPGSGTVSINLSAQSVGDPAMLDFITAALERSGMEPRRVCFEITETVAITSMVRAQALLAGLRRLGCATALDDFGVGYSSFAYLKDLPVDRVKIDASFVRGLEGDRLKRAMVRAMNEVAHALGKETVAEGVETEGELAVLRAIGVDCAQGYLFGRPEVATAPRASPARRAGGAEG